jgi:hypothetical protein
MWIPFVRTIPSTHSPIARRNADPSIAGMRIRPTLPERTPGGPQPVAMLLAKLKSYRILLAEQFLFPVSEELPVERRHAGDPLKFELVSFPAHFEAFGAHARIVPFRRR